MKRTYSRFVRGLMVAVVAFALPLFSQSVHAQGVVINDGFEDSYDGWTNAGDNAQLTAVRGEGYNSSRAMKVTGRKSPQDGAVAMKGFYLDAGAVYNYSVYVKHAGKSAETFKLTLQWLLPDGKTYASDVIATAVAQPNKWTQLAVSYATPEGSAKPTFFITTNSTVDFYFDEFTATGRSAGLAKAAAMPPANIGLKDIYAKHFRVGNILNSGTANNAGIRSIILLDYNSISMENEHKPYATMTKTGSTNTDIKATIGSGAAAAMNFCSQNGIPMRGHVLTWHGQSPDWFFIRDINDERAERNTTAGTRYRDILVNQVPWADTATMNRRLESYIKNLFAMYAAQYPNLRFYAYDVTNEAFDGAGNMRPAGFDHDGAGGQTASNSGDSPWQAVYGNNNTTWIRNAFTYARKYAPSYTKLFYNDFNEWQSGKKEGIRDKVLIPLRDAKVLDGMGMQSHVSANPGGWASESNHLSAMDFYANLNIEVQLTELDVSTDGGQWASNQATRYANIFSKAIEINKRNVGKITAICIWTPNDANTWIGSNNAPALHDAQNNRKAAYQKVAEVVPQADWGDGKNPTFGGGGSTNYNLTVSSNPSDGGTVTLNPNSTSYAKDASVRLTAQASQGWKFVGWEGDVTGSTNPATITMTKNSVVTAKFEQLPIAPDANGYFFHHTYEDGTVQGWTARFGGATLANTNAQKANGQRSLSVSARSESYIGPSYSLNTAAFVPGKSYSFSVLAMHTNGSASGETFKFTLQYVLDGETSYNEIATATAARNQWVLLNNTNFPIPAGATGLVLYVETLNDATMDFYIDDAMGGVAGTPAPGRGGVTSASGANARMGALPLMTVKGRTLAVNASPDSKVQVKVVNLTGKTIANYSAQGKANISLKKVPAGTYIIEVRQVRDGAKMVSHVVLR